MAVSVTFGIFGNPEGTVSEDNNSENTKIIEISSKLKDYLSKWSIATIRLEIENGEIISAEFVNISETDVQELKTLLSIH